MGGYTTEAYLCGVETSVKDSQDLSLGKTYFIKQVTDHENEHNSHPVAKIDESFGVDNTLSPGICPWRLSFVGGFREESLLSYNYLHQLN
jgi:hypothetical protein